MDMKDRINKLLHKHYPLAGDDFDCMDFIHNFGSASQAILYSMLYMPELIEINGSVLLACNLPNEDMKKEFNSKLKKTTVSRKDLEASFNFLEIGYIFNPPGRDTNDKEDELLAEQLASAWEGYLNFSFPERNFIVEVIPASQTGSTVGIHFFEKY